MLDVITLIRDRMRGTVEKGKKRSSKWRKVRQKHIEEFPVCYGCGTNKKLEVHHIVPFSLDPSLELVPENLVTLCDGGGRSGLKSCHYLFGHLGCWKSFNPTVMIDARIWSDRLTAIRNSKLHKIEEAKKGLSGKKDNC